MDEYINRERARLEAERYFKNIITFLIKFI